MSGASVSNLFFKIVDKCPGKRILNIRDNHFPAMTIKNNAFGEKFTAKPPSVATVTVSGHLSGRTVSGTLMDRSRNNETHHFCTGKATFKLRPT